MRVLHLFNWHLSDIASSLPVVANYGFDAIQINPIQPLKDEYSSEWWMSYQPIDFKIGNKFGSKEDLKYLCDEANNYNIRIIADVVCNHMAGDNSGALIPHENVSNYLKENPYYWKENRPVTNWDDRYEVVNYCMGLPGLNLNHPDVQFFITNFIEDLINCGVRGIRFDAAKSIALPREGCNFWEVIHNNFSWRDITKYGEILFEDPNLIYEYANYIGVLTENCSLDHHRIFNFIESHDSYYHFGYTKGMNGYEINDRYHELTKFNENTVYFARPYDNAAWQNDYVKMSNKVKEYVYK